MRRKFLVYSLLAALASIYIYSLAVPLARAENVAPVLITQAVEEGKLVTLGGNTRPEANTRNDRGPVADSLLMDHMLLQLKRSPERERELQKLIDELTDSSSPNFHRWLTAREFGERFGVARQDRETIKNWLQSQGFKVNVDYENGVLIDFSGTAGEVRQAFHTEIHNLEVQGVNHIANMSDPKIPAALAPVVVGVLPLHDFKPHPMYQRKANYTVGGGTYLVVPGDLATIYNLNPLFSAGISGQGQTIVAVEDSNVYSTADWTSFRSVFGLSSYTGGSLTEVHPAPPSGSNNCFNPGVGSAAEEATLDAEYASAAAPSAAIVIASCSGTYGVLTAMQNLLNESSTPPAVMSMSYGECEASNGATSNAAFSSTFQQAVTEGVSVFVSSGDDSAAGCDRGATKATHGIGITGWGSSPYNVSVGGTDFGDTFAGTNSTYWNATNTPTYESAKSYVPEIPWEDSCASLLIAEFRGFSQTYGSSGFCNSAGVGNFLTVAGGSGGPSGCATGTPSQAGVVSGTCAGWPKPGWQSLVGNPSDGVRDVPDVSLFAANGVWGHYYPFCFTGPGGVPCTDPPNQWPGAGGTSFSSPIMAGIQALVDQKAGGRQGNPNPVYYSLAASEYGASGDPSCSSTLGNATGSSCTFYDVTQGDMDVDCTGTNNCYLDAAANGVLSTSNSAYQPAFGTTTGWDFATGIGTVNAYNLVNNWPGGSPNFTLSPSPNTLTITQGSSGASTITVTPSNGFSGTVSLAASGLPNGVTAAFNPNPATGSSLLTLTAGATAATGTVTVTVTGTSGTLTNKTTLSLTVNAQGQSFTLSALPNTVTIAKGGASGASAITISPLNGFSGSVTLAASGLPKGVTASFSPNPATSSSVLTLTASATAKTGTVTVTITGTSASLSATTTISLTVNALGNFSLTASPKTVTVAQGSSGTSTITIKPGNGFDQNVTLSASNVPAGVTASFSPNPATSTSTLTLAVSDSAAIAKTTITVTGTYGNLSHSTTVNLNAVAP
ncbi:MAG: protease pro-enzyme activation domain-containing protein [Terriglobales bacterium]